MLKSIASGDLSRRSPASNPEATTLICFSHLRWDFVYQRPQHLLSRFARTSRVFYVEEPTFGADRPHLEISGREYGLRVVVPQLPNGLSESAQAEVLRELVDELIADESITASSRGTTRPWRCRGRGISSRSRSCTTAWTSSRSSAARRRRWWSASASSSRSPTSCSPAARASTKPSARAATTCTAFRAASTPRTSARRAFRASDPADQANIPHLRLGFAGVIDERMDIDLLAELASARPDWHLVLVGPIVKINPDQLPQASEHPLPRRQAIRRAAVVHGGLGCGALALRAERVDALHQPDEDARVSRRGAAGGVDTDSRCRCAVRRGGAREDRQDVPPIS